jgi:hypothetical protein
VVLNNILVSVRGHWSLVNDDFRFISSTRGIPVYCAYVKGWFVEVLFIASST